MKTTSVLVAPRQQVSSMAWFLMFLLSIVWGTSFSLIKEGLRVYSPTEVAALRISSAFLVMIVPACWHFKQIPANKIGFLLLSGLLGNLIPAFLFAFAQTQITTSVSSILNSLTPFFAFSVGVVFFKKQAHWQKIVGIGLGILGTLFIFIQKEGVSFNYFALLIVLATICYGFNVNLTAKFLNNIKPLHISSISIAMVGIMASIFLLGFTNFWQVSITHPEALTSLSYIVVLGVVGSGVSSILFYKLLQMSSPVFASSVTYLIPIVGVSIGMYRGEEITLWHLLGMGLIIVGVLVMNKTKS